MRLESLGFHAVTATPGCPCPRSTQPQAPSASCPWVSAQRSQDCPRHPPTSPSALAPCCRLAGGGGRQRRVTGGHPGSQTQSQGTGVPGGRKLASSLSSFSGTVPLPEASQPAVAGMEPPARRGLPKVAAETRNSAECESPSLPGGFSLPAPGKGGRVLPRLPGMSSHSPQEASWQGGSQGTGGAVRAHLQGRAGRSPLSWVRSAAP